MFQKKNGEGRISKIGKPFFLRKDNAPIKLECIPKWNGLERIPILLKDCFFLKKELSYFRKPFRVIPIRNAEQRIPQLL